MMRLSTVGSFLFALALTAVLAPGRLQAQKGNDPTGLARPTILSGQVAMDNGAPLPEPAAIEIICNGEVRPETYTDLKGKFTFQIGHGNSVMADAGQRVNATGAASNTWRAPNREADYEAGDAVMSDYALQGCEMRASLPGYRSDTLSLAKHRQFDTDVGAILLHRAGGVEGSTVSVTGRGAPEEAKKAYGKGSQALKKNKAREARKEFQKAVAAYPKYAAAWFGLGQAQEMLEQPAEARASYEHALEADDKFVQPYLQLAMMDAHERKWQQAAERSARLIRLDPVDFPQAWFVNSAANCNLGNLDAAEKSVRVAQKLDTGHRFPRVNHLLGTILASRRDFSGAAAEMRNYLKYAPQAQDAAAVRSQVAEWEKLAGGKPQP